MTKALIVRFGGTILSETARGVRDLDRSSGAAERVHDFLERQKLLIKAPNLTLIDSQIDESDQILSENLTVSRLKKLYDHIREFEGSIDSVLIFHGTDTVAYSAPLFSFLFEGTGIPVVFACATKPLFEDSSDGAANVAFALDILARRPAGGAYVPCLDRSGRMFLHCGERLVGFGPSGAVSLGGGYAFAKRRRSEFFAHLLVARPTGLKTRSLEGWTPSEALYLRPYPGLDYSRISLDGIRGAVHGSYHSGTVCAEGDDSRRDDARSFWRFALRCADSGIPVFVADQADAGATYATSDEISESGVATFVRMPGNVAYAKLHAILPRTDDPKEVVRLMKKNAMGEIRR